MQLCNGCVSLWLLQVSVCEWMRVLYGEMKLRMQLCESAVAANVCVCVNVKIQCKHFSSKSVIVFKV